MAHPRHGGCTRCVHFVVISRWVDQLTLQETEGPSPEFSTCTAASRGCAYPATLHDRRREASTLAKRRRVHNEEAWRNAKKLCRLSSRQVAMARALGMNPKKLPGLRPSPQQRWKHPVGAFIEECYRKRFGTAPVSDESRQRERESWSPPDDAGKVAIKPRRQLENLVCYLVNFSNDLEKWIVHGRIGPEVLAAMRGELREIADALEAGTVIRQMPEIPIPPDPQPAGSVPGAESEGPFDGDDEIPF
jgi:hypothetical protein